MNDKDLHVRALSSLTASARDAFSAPRRPQPRPLAVRATPFTARRISAEELAEVHAGFPAECTVPFEQGSTWSRIFEGNPFARLGGMFVIEDQDGAAVATCLITERGEGASRQAAADDGPVFAREPDAATEAGVLNALVSALQSEPAPIPFVLRIRIRHTEALEGVRPSMGRGIFEREVVVPLADAPVPLEKAFSSSARNTVRKARRQGVVVREVTENREDVFERECHPVLAQTAERDGFGALPVWYFRRLLSLFPEEVRLYTAEVPGYEGCAAWAMSSAHRGWGTYLHAASTSEGQKAGAPSLLLTTLLESLREQGCTGASLTGIGSPAWPELARLEGFKLKFSKTIVEHPSCMDIPLTKRYDTERRLIEARKLARRVRSRARQALGDLAGKIRPDGAPRNA
ncbi:peptidoglycan bridge formation glycyltransferase FemA/FemB family protein [Arthrobacter sp. UM1]|uniref:peptidoglycan bridge formation glycyltransferase FemA/FemB family protein n=1 Tax=Arthrobacter sp. UM1 TaxID=2766776 RepID=UPI001CF6CC02|nr:peptidoglycan bridge formation glycyltransferase FemA/FemB family protein [Arthrobacter sp. UM1]MCB4208664.1 GNAT family N-acetyltransferase [Arthrobacter sp. UM1]